MRPFQLTETTVDAGATRPFRLLHVTDTHIARADEADDARKQDLARKRAALFEADDPGCTIEHFGYAAAFANQHDAILVHTGDLFDFVSHAHEQLAPELLSLPRDYLTTMGNHEYSLYVGEAFEDAKYKALRIDRVQAMFPRYDVRFAARVVNGVNLVCLDDVYYDFTAEQLGQLEAEVAKGLPIILFVHVPLYTPQLWEVMAGAAACSAVGVPAELMEGYDDYRYRQQITTPQTRKYLDYLFGLDCLQAVFAGHLHLAHESRLPNGAMQYVTDAQFRNAARLIQVR